LFCFPFFSPVLFVFSFFLPLDSNHENVLVRLAGGPGQPFSSAQRFPDGQVVLAGSGGSARTLRSSS
jgi:hypothetical protein